MFIKILLTFYCLNDSLIILNFILLALFFKQYSVQVRGLARIKREYVYITADGRNPQTKTEEIKKQFVMSK